MTLELEDILDIINNNPNYELIKAAKEQHEKLYMHYTGIGVENYIEDLDEFLREGSRDTLIKLIKGNKDIIQRVMQPRNKIYTAKGGLWQVNLPDEVQTEFEVYLSEITEGMTLNDWIKQRIQPNYDYDPNSIIHIEINSDNEPYPKHRCITEIYDYTPNGRALEYLVLIVSDDDVAAYVEAGLLPPDLPPRTRIYRVIDDAYDRIIYMGTKQGKPKYELQQMNVSSELPNEFGYVPCIIISDIYGCEKPIKKDSPLSCVINILDRLLTHEGLTEWGYWRNAFPKEWMQLIDCTTCEGIGEINGQPCPECKGSKITPYLRTSDVVKVKYDSDKNMHPVPNPPMGIVSPDIAALQFMADNCMSLEDYFNFTIWGVAKTMPGTMTKAAPAGKGGGGQVSSTAYEANLKNQEKEDKQYDFGTWRVSIMKFIVDTCAWYKYRANYKGCAIIQGDRFLNESSDATWDRYTKAVAAKAPMYALDSLLTEYNQNKYDKDPEGFRRAELMRQVEPFVHESVDVIWIDQTLPMIQRLMKKYFDEWTSTITAYDIASIPDEGGADILRGMLENYVTGKYVADRKKDAILLSAMGVVLEIGDQVEVIRGREKKPEHTGQIYTVDSIVDGNVTIKGGGMDGVFGYTMDDVVKVQKNRIAA